MTCGDKEPRLFENLDAHLFSKSHINKIPDRLKAAWNKHVIDNFTFELTETNTPEEGFTQQNIPKKMDMVEEEKLDKSQFRGVNDKKHKNLTYFRFLITNFIMKHNLPFTFADNFRLLLTDLLLKFDPSQLISYTINQNHVRYIAHNGFCKFLKLKYFKKLELSPYSISIDEATLHNVEYLAINARFMEDSECTKSTTKLIGLIKMDDSSTGEALYETVSSFLFQGNGGDNRQKNLLGISTDNALNMISSKTGGATNKFCLRLPYLVITRDLCHCFNLILKKSIHTLPGIYRSIISDIVETFTSSSLQTSRLQKMFKDEELNTRRQKAKSIIKYNDTRWSSFYDCIKRILEIKGPLKQYFDLYGNTKEKLYLGDVKNVHMLELFKCLVEKIIKAIIFFETDNLDTLAIIRH